MLRLRIVTRIVDRLGSEEVKRQLRHMDVIHNKYMQLSNNNDERYATLKEISDALNTRSKQLDDWSKALDQRSKAIDERHKALSRLEFLASNFRTVPKEDGHDDKERLRTGG